MTALFRREATHPYTETRISRSGSVFGFPPEPRRGNGKPEHGAVRRGLARVVARIREFAYHQRVMSELANLSDHELADIGLARADINRIFDADFAARHAQEYGYRA